MMQIYIYRSLGLVKSFRPPFSKGGGVWGGAPRFGTLFAKLFLVPIQARKSVLRLAISNRQTLFFGTIGAKKSFAKETPLWGALPLHPTTF